MLFRFLPSFGLWLVAWTVTVGWYHYENQSVEVISLYLPWVVGLVAFIPVYVVASFVLRRIAKKE